MNSKQQSADRPGKRLLSHWNELVGKDLWECRWRLISAYLFSLLSVGAIVLLPWPLKLTIDYILAGHSLPPLFTEFLRVLTINFEIDFSNTNLIFLFACSYVFIALIAAIFSAIDKLITSRIREKLVMEVRMRILARLLGLPLPMRSNYSKGDLVFRISGDVYQFVRLLSKTIPTIFRHLALSLFTLGVMFWIQPWLALIGFTIVCIMAIVVIYFGARLHENSVQKRAFEGDVAGFSQEVVNGLPTVQALGCENHIQQKFRTINSKSLAAGVNQVLIAVGMERSMQIINGVAVATIMGGGALFVLRGQMTVGDLTVFIAYMIQLLKPVEKINELALAVSRGISRGERLFSLYAEIPELRDRSDARPVTNCKGRIEFRCVHFTYAENSYNRTLLNGISFTLERGQLAVLTGPSGSGKSTLVSLLLRQFQPLSGEICLDNTAYPKLTLESLRKQFAVMLQRHDLFAGTLREALWMNETPVDETLIWHTLNLVDLKQYFQELPAGLETDVVEDGINLSGGQRARLSLARTLLLDRPILLLDEPLANIDAKSQSIILNALDQIRNSKTCLVISHQSVLIERADIVLNLETGNLTQSVHNDFKSSAKGLV